ncbi:MAG: rplO [Deltaproteobacteria bacterium]|uniref:Large ribosomal subunit protein uL15 n=1 Tax=uncultured delta proteobacterium Rifle_16ft_4_minimus_809 TaxID=1665185 RepID=A0A0H4TVA8_9DELT|nr:50S ribosomal protein L15, large subunit ribosomal protein L15 [uncultured delta proteobacterium Rifle_16ft_4_minimus_809]MBF8250399.1 rplO [Deltaproteobacteria bacterium]
MNLGELRAPEGASKNRKRLGRGSGSGHGKTSGRGHKGQRARSGGRGKTGFEGGQMPLQRRLPKRGFTNIFRKEYAIVNLSDLDRFEKGSTVDLSLLVAAGLVNKIGAGVKLLADGDIKKSLTIKVHKFSQSAKAKVEAAGGRIEVV